MAVYQSLTLTKISQNVDENSSRVRILWKSTQTGGSYNLTDRTGFCYVSVNGAEEETIQKTYTLPEQATVTILDETVTVYHNTRGAATVTVRTWMDTHISAGEVTLSKTLELPEIPRESVAQASSCVVGGVCQIAVDRKNTAFSHTLRYEFGELSGYIKPTGARSDTAVKTKKEAISFIVPESFYSQMPASRSKSCTLTCKTYSGDTQIGEATTAVFNVRVDETLCAPTVSGTVVDTNAKTVALTGDSSTLVRFCSNALCTITAAATCDAAAIAVKKIGGKTVTGSTRTVTGIETDTVRFYAKDSRGIENSVAVKSGFVKYIKLTNNASVTRTEETSGEAVLTLSGAYFAGSFGAAENSLKLQYKIGSASAVTVSDPTVTDGKYSAKVSLTDMDYTRSYTVTVTVSDKLMSVTKTLTLKKGTPVFDWGEADFRFNVPVYMGNVEMDYIVAQGKTDGWYYRKWNSGIAECWKQLAHETAFTTLWNTLYAGTVTDRQDYPFAFTSRPLEQATLMSDAWQAWLYPLKGSDGLNTTIKSARYNLCRDGIVETTGTYYICYFVIGNWK